MSNKKVILFGYGSENLTKYFEKNLTNFKIIKIDNFNLKYKINNLLNTSYHAIIFSCHLHIDKFFYNIYCEQIKNFINPSEIINKINFKKKFYLIHDLTEFYHKNEINFLEKMDYILSPVKYDDPLFKKKVKCIGWVKNYKTPKNINILNKKIFFISDVFYYERNIFKFEKDFKPFLEKFDYYKLPFTINKLEKLKKILKKYKISEISSNNDSYQYLKNNIIYTNGQSSIISETLIQGNSIQIIISETNKHINFNNYFLYSPLKNLFKNLKLIKKKNLISIYSSKKNYKIKFNLNYLKKLLS